MIQFCNEKYDISTFSDVDLFVCTICYEQRSYYLLDQVINTLDDQTVLIFATDNYSEYEVSRKKVLEIQQGKHQINVVNYQDHSVVTSHIKSIIQAKMTEKPTMKIIIDYSSMPRSWYTRLPGVLEEILRPNDIVYFWYCEGDYPVGYSEYPTAGADKVFEHFSGRASLLPEKRTHIFALSYDISRTQGIIEKCEPEYIILCEAHDPIRGDIHQNIIKANENLMAQAAMVVSLDLSDFSFMVTKLREIANELIKSSDVVFMPDGPKPLIMAMSQIPILIKEPGISCVHVKRDLNKLDVIDVTASGKVVGFSMRIAI